MISSSYTLQSPKLCNHLENDFQQKNKDIIRHWLNSGKLHTLIIVTDVGRASNEGIDCRTLEFIDTKPAKYQLLCVIFYSCTGSPLPAWHIKHAGKIWTALGVITRFSCDSAGLAFCLLFLCDVAGSASVKYSCCPYFLFCFSLYEICKVFQYTRWKTWRPCETSTPNVDKPSKLLPDSTFCVYTAWALKSVHL